MSTLTRREAEQFREMARKIDAETLRAAIQSATMAGNLSISAHVAREAGREDNRSTGGDAGPGGGKTGK